MFCVIVHVLSVQRTVAAHKVSTAVIFLVSTFFLDILHAHIARNTVSTTGNSSGKIPIAKVNHDNNHCVQSPCIILYARKTTIHKKIAMINAAVTIFLTSFWRSVFSSVISLSAFPMRHISVFIPMEVTFATHCHWTIMLPEKMNGKSSPPGLFFS